MPLEDPSELVIQEQRASNLRCIPHEKDIDRAPIYYSSFHFLFHYSYVTPIYNSVFHLIFHCSYIVLCIVFGCGQRLVRSGEHGKSH